MYAIMKSLFPMCLVNPSNLFLLWGARTWYRLRCSKPQWKSTLASR